MNNIYDTANNLAEEIKKSQEYKEYKAAREAVIADENMKAKINEFEKLRYEVQMLSIEKGEQSPEKMQKLQQMYDVLVSDKEIKEYFDIEVKFNVMIADINKIIGQAIEGIYKM